MELFEFAVYAYLAIGSIKLALVAVDVPVAAAVVHRLTGRPMWLTVLSLSISVLLVSLLMWPKILVDEGWRFLLAYTRFGVMRDIVKVYRTAGMNPAELHG